MVGPLWWGHYGGDTMVGSRCIAWCVYLIRCFTDCGFCHTESAESVKRKIFQVFLCYVGECFIGKQTVIDHSVLKRRMGGIHVAL